MSRCRIHFLVRFRFRFLLSRFRFRADSFRSGKVLAQQRSGLEHLDSERGMLVAVPEAESRSRLKSWFGTRLDKCNPLLKERYHLRVRQILTARPANGAVLLESDDTGLPQYQTRCPIDTVLLPENATATPGSPSKVFKTVVLFIQFTIHF